MTRSAFVSCSALSCLFSLVACGGDSPTGTSGAAIAIQYTGGSIATGGVPITLSGGQLTLSSGGIQSIGTGGVTTPDTTVSATGGDMTTPVTSDLPCDIQQVLETNCWKCHNNPPNWGAPMSLVTQADFLAMGTVTTTSVVRDLAKTRINAATSPMPPLTEPAMNADDLAALNQWLDAGTPLGDGSSCDAVVDMGTGGTTTTEDPNDPYASIEPWSSEPGWPNGTPPQETCYQFLKHGANTPGDTSPMVTANGEFYVTFYYKVPWTEPSLATKWRTVYDQTQILHHWLLYESSAAVSKDGTFDTPTPASSLTAGLHTTAGNLVAGWAVGGGAEGFPAGVGMKMPAPGGMFELEWHLWNSTGGDVADRSGIELCVVPQSAVDPKYVASMNWLGTEDLVIAPNATTQRGGVCTPGFSAGAPATIITWQPHMHLIGVHMDTWVMHADGTEDHVFNEPFGFDAQISHRQDPPYQVNQGDRLHSVCTFNNPNSATVLFGQSTTSEMCYQFVVSYPDGSLTGLPGSNSVLTGANNGCGLTPNDMSPVHTN